MTPPADARGVLGSEVAARCLLAVREQQAENARLAGILAESQARAAALDALRSAGGMASRKPMERLQRDAAAFRAMQALPGFVDVQAKAAALSQPSPACELLLNRYTR